MRKYRIAIISSVLLSLLLTAVSLQARVDVTIPQSCIDSAKSVLSEVTLTAVNASLDQDYRYTVKAGDSQLFIDGIDDRIGGVIIQLKDPLPKGTEYQLYFSINGSEIGETNSIHRRLTYSTDQLIFRFYEFGIYDLFRLDLDTNYQIEDISVVVDASTLSTGRTALAALLEDWTKFPFRQLTLCLVIMLCQSLLIAWKLDAIKRFLGETWRKVRENRRKLLHSVIICFICMADSLLVWAVLHEMGISKSPYMLTKLCFMWIGLGVGLLISMRRQFDCHPERGFLIIALCIGMLFAVMEPVANLLSCDDEIHYGNAVRLSYGNEDYITAPEQLLYNRGTSIELTIENRLMSAIELDLIPFTDFGDSTDIAPVPYTTIPAYLPVASAIWLTRMLGFSMSTTAVAGRIANLLCYALVVFFSIRQLKHGKLFTSVLCLLPTPLFMAGNFSYDPFCIAFILLGTCIWLGVYQRPEARMTGIKATAMLIAFMLGVLTKAVYFPFVLTTLFLPENRFSSKCAAKRYRWCVILTALALAASFAVPFLLSGGSGEQYSDPRGGDVNAAAQVAFILANPLRYLNTLAFWLFRVYFLPVCILGKVNGSVRSFFFVSEMDVIFPDAMIYMLLGLIFVTWLFSFDYFDRRDRGAPVWVMILACVFMLGALSIAATSMYCAFTPVGFNGINGFQERYMLPVVMPLLVIVRPSLFAKRIPRIKWINTAFFFATYAILIAGTWPFLKCFI